MKQMKKIASILLAMVMVLGMSMTAFATGATPPMDSTDEGNTKSGQGEFTLTISDKTEGYTYAIYQIFKGDLSKDANDTKTLSNITWGANIDEEKAAEVFITTKDGNEVAMTAREVAESISTESKNEFDTEVAKKFAANIAKCIKGATVDDNGNIKLPEESYKNASYNSATGYTFDKLDAGYYMVANTKVPEGTDVALTRYMMEIVGDVTAAPKKGIPTSEKKIVDRQLVCESKEEGHVHNDGCYADKVDTNEASIGDEVKYEITGTMPSNIADYKTYYYVFEDTLSKGLTFQKDSVVVTVDEVDVTKYFYVGATDYDEEKGTTITIGIEDLLALKNIKEKIRIDFTADTKVVVTYTAILNENAVIAGDGNPNDVKLTYSNDPNNSGDGSTEPPKEEPDKPEPKHPTGETPKDEVVTYTTELTILKTKEDEKTFLPGVEFTLTGNGVKVVLITEEKFEKVGEGETGEYWKLKDGTFTKTAPTVAEDETNNTEDYESIVADYKKTTTIVKKGIGTSIGGEVINEDVVGTVQADGTVTFKGLGVGEYTITETKTLPGYNTIEPIKFNLTFDAMAKKFESDNENVTVGEANTLDTLIVNQSGSLLPSTGGIGTTIFYIVGGVLVIGAGILLVAKKRMSAK